MKPAPTRRNVLHGFTALAGGAALAACGAQAQGTAPAAETRNYAGTTLQLWGSYSASYRDVMLQHFDRFAQLHAPGLKTEMQIYTNNDFITKLTAALAGGTGPDFNRFKDHEAIDMAVLKAAAPIDGYLSKEKVIKLSDFTTQSVEGSKFQNKTYGVPHHHQFAFLGWNKGLFRAAGINPDKTPETWSELRDYARRLTSLEKDQWGFQFQEFGEAREQHFNWYMEWVWRNGGDIWNRERTRNTMDSPESIDTMQYMVDLMYADKSTIPPDRSQINVNTGKLGMYMPNGAGVLNLKVTHPNLDFGVGPMPRQKQFVTQLRHNTFTIMTNSKLPDLTWKAIVYMAGDEVMADWQADPAVSTVPVKKSLYEKAPWSDANSGWKPIIDVVRMPGNRPKPFIPGWDEYCNTIVVPALYEAWRQTKSPKDALTEGARKANLWLAQRPKLS